MQESPKTGDIADFFNLLHCGHQLRQFFRRKNASSQTLRFVANFRVDWQWIPAWRPADITGTGRDQLRAIGFTI